MEGAGLWDEAERSGESWKEIAGRKRRAGARGVAYPPCSKVATGGCGSSLFSRTADERRAPRFSSAAGAAALDALTSQHRDVGVVTDAH